MPTPKGKKKGKKKKGNAGGRGCEREFVHGDRRSKGLVSALRWMTIGAMVDCDCGKSIAGENVCTGMVLLENTTFDSAGGRRESRCI